MKNRVLIVEDEPLLAMAMSDHLTDCGFEIAGIAPTVEKALSLLHSACVDVAVLDCNLRGESVEGIAAALKSMAIPFLFHTGYGADPVYKDYAHVPCLAKPVASEVLIEAVRRLVQTS